MFHTVGSGHRFLLVCTWPSGPVLLLEPLHLQRAAEIQGGFFCNQFENLANFRAHYHGTGPEICQQVKETQTEFSVFGWA